MSAAACVEAARRYAELGWSLVVLEPGAKRPLAGRPWARAQRERADVAEVLELLEAHAGANLGLVAGSVSGGAVAVDVDEPGPLPVEFPKGPVVESATPGHEHRYFTAARPVPTAMGLFGRRVELRGEKALLVLPPSRVNGREYLWRGDPARGLPALPAEILRAAQAATKRVPMATLLRGVVEGARNIAAARVVGFFLHRCATGEEAWAAAVAWNARNVPPLDQGELRTVFDKIANRARRLRRPGPSGREALEDWVVRLVARAGTAAVWQLHHAVGGALARHELEQVCRALAQQGRLRLACLGPRGAVKYQAIARAAADSQTPRREAPEPPQRTTPGTSSTVHTPNVGKDGAERPSNHSTQVHTTGGVGPGQPESPSAGPVAAAAEAAVRGPWDGRVTAPNEPVPKIEQVWKRLPTGQLVVSERQRDGRLRAVGWSLPEKQEAVT